MNVNYIAFILFFKFNCLNIIFLFLHFVNITTYKQDCNFYLYLFCFLVILYVLNSKKKLYLRNFISCENIKLLLVNTIIINNYTHTQQMLKYI